MEQIIAPLGADMMSEWCNSFFLVPETNGKVWLCLDPVRLNKVLIRPMNRGPTLKNISPRLVGVKYLTLIHASLGYHNLKLDGQSYLTSFFCPFCRYRYM